jgi:WD40 repeat protein
MKGELFLDLLVIDIHVDGEFRVWNFQGQVLHTIQAHSELVRTLSLVGHKLISGSYDKQIKVWDLATMKQTLLIRNIPDVGQIVTLQATDTKIIVSMVNANHLYLIDFSENIDISVL